MNKAKEIKQLEEMYQKSNMEEEVISTVFKIDETLGTAISITADFLFYADIYFVIMSKQAIKTFASQGLPLTIMTEDKIIKFWSREDLNKIPEFLKGVYKWKKTLLSKQN